MPYAPAVIRMNRAVPSLALALAALPACSQVPTFTQVARYDLGALPANNLPTAVAFDGANAYVATSSSGAAGTTLYKIADALNNAGQTKTTFATQPTAAGGSRAADLVFAKNSLYWGYGLGTAGAPGASLGTASTERPARASARTARWARSRPSRRAAARP